MAAVGPLQFEVVQARMMSEYGVEVRLETIPYSCARWAMAGWDDVDAADADGRTPLLWACSEGNAGAAAVPAPRT